jgi:hypothetical protein
VAELKACVPSSHRGYHRPTRTWTVREPYASEASDLALFHQPDVQYIDHRASRQAT